MAGQHLVQDAGSANGTFLNGMRLRQNASCALREGDILEIGNTRFLYGAEPGAPTRGAPVGEPTTISDAAHPLVDLLRDGAGRSDVGEERAEFVRAFVGVSPVTGLERSLEIVARRIGADAVAFFMQGPGDSLNPVAWRPGDDVARGLATIAKRAASAREGRLLRGFMGGSGAAEIHETAVRPCYSAGAVPFLDGDVVAGVLAIERVHEKRLDRVELARLAFMADAIARTLALGEHSPDDTRVGGGTGPGDAVVEGLSSSTSVA